MIEHLRKVAFSSSYPCKKTKKTLFVQEKKANHVKVITNRRVWFRKVRKDVLVSHQALQVRLTALVPVNVAHVSRVWDGTKAPLECPL